MIKLNFLLIIFILFICNMNEKLNISLVNIEMNIFDYFKS